MINYNLQINSANAEVYAMESYLNLNLFLDCDCIGYAPESSIVVTLTKIKEYIIKFFKKLIGTIYSFFVNLFGNSERLMHKKAVTLIVESLNRWKIELSSIDNNISKVIRVFSENHDIASRSSISKVADDINDIKNECIELEDKIDKLVTSNRDKTEYTLIRKDSFNILNTFTDECKNTVSRIINVLELSISKMREKEKSLCQQQINSILIMSSTITSRVIDMIKTCSWDTKLEENETKLENPVTLIIED